MNYTHAIYRRYINLITRMSRLSALSELVLNGSEYVVQDILEKLSWPDIQRALRADTSLVAVLNQSYLLRPYLDGRRLTHDQAVVLAWLRSVGEEYESVEDEACAVFYQSCSKPRSR